MTSSTKLSNTIKSITFGAFITIMFGLPNLNTVQAQDVSTGVDLYSTYVWRGSAFSGPSLQPYVEFGSGGFAIEAWGSQGYDGFQEMDLYAGFSFDFGLSLGVTDYYYPGSPWLDGDSHAIEISLGYSTESISLSGNFIVNEAPGAGSDGGDLYFEAGYSFTEVTSAFIGAGNGWHTVEDNPLGEDDFGLVNIGVTTAKEITITDTFSIPLTGSVVLNPYTEQLYIFAGFSF